MGALGFGAGNGDYNTLQHALIGIKPPSTFVDYSFRTLFYTAIFPFTIPVATMEFIDHNIYNWSSSEYNALISKHKKEPKWDQLVNHFKKQEEILPQFDDSEIKRLLLLNKK